MIGCSEGDSLSDGAGATPITAVEDAVVVVVFGTNGTWKDSSVSDDTRNCFMGLKAELLMVELLILIILATHAWVCGRSYLTF